MEEEDIDYEQLIKGEQETPVDNPSGSSCITVL